MRAHRMLVRMAGHEYGNELMKLAAQEAADSHPDAENLVVEVYEHAGWSLSWYRDGGNLVTVETANDTAVFQGRARDIRVMLSDQGVEWVRLPTVHRDELVRA